MCDRVAIIHAGRVVREGAVDELLAGDRELEDVFIEVVEGAGGGTGYGPAGGWASPLPPPVDPTGQPGAPPPPASGAPPGGPPPPASPPTEHPPWLRP
jgi:hypothetical protein